MASLKVAMVVLLCMAVMGAPMTQAGVTCGQAASKIAPCFAYLSSKGPLTPPCCNGVKGLLALAQTTADRQAICNCLKSNANTIPGLNLRNAATLPSNCGVSIPYKISPNTNCASIK